MPGQQPEGNALLDPVLQRARHEPDRLFALLHEKAGWTPVSFGTVMRRAMQFAALFRQQAVQRGEVVFLVLKPGLDAYAAFIGAMCSGAIPSFLPYPNVKQQSELYWRQQAAVFQRVGCSLIVAYDDLLAEMTVCADGSGARVVAAGAVDRHDPLPPPAPPDIDAIALLQHSSGTTGLKKGVALSYRSIALQLDSYRQALSLSPGSARIVSWLPLYHDMGLISSFLLPLWLGVPILSIDPFVWIGNPGLFLDAIQDHGATHAWLPNFAFMHLARRARSGVEWRLGTLKMLVNCSEPCKPETFDAFLHRFGRQGVDEGALQTCYAMAETVFAVSQSDRSRPVRRLAVAREHMTDHGQVRDPAPGTDAVVLLSNGRPVPGCEVAILREEVFVGVREIGEICVRADFLFSGYFRQPDASAAALRDGWYRTGDLGFLDEDEIFVVGRIKDMIIVNGKNLFAHDIEAAVSVIAGIRPGRCVAFGRYSAQTGSEQLIVVAERDDTTHADADLQRGINHAVIDEVGVSCSDVRIVDPDWLVKTTSGKMSRSENAKRYDDFFR